MPELTPVSGLPRTDLRHRAPAPRLTPLEIASGVVLGFEVDTAPSGDGYAGSADPLVALERAVAPALRRPPCLVSFSGGLDSSLVLAVAVRVARRDGLPDPVPVTWRFTGAPAAEESSWQDTVVAALDVRRDWQILRAEDDLDLLGPVARRTLREHGLLHPANIHLHVPILALGPGGSLLTGAGGDQVLAGCRPLATAVTPAARLRRMAGTVRGLTTRGVARLVRQPDRRRFPWLSAEAADRMERTLRAEGRAEPHEVGAGIAWHLRRRDLTLTCASLATVAERDRVAVRHPLLDAGFVAALTDRYGQRPRPARTALLADIAAGRLPAEVIAPRPKARFLEVFFRTPTREFVHGWATGGGELTGVDEDLVDVDALRRIWSRWPIPGCTATLLQHLWLTTTTGEG